MISGKLSLIASFNFSEIKSRLLWEKSIISWFEAGRNKPDDNVSDKYFLR
jgi:general stress protein 26